MIKKVLLLGSGALKIGEAGEFDYSGSQAIKALKEEGVEVVLVNPNIATIQTSEDLADRVYFLPVTADFVEKVIAQEKPEGILLGFGGQTALNCGVELYRRKVFKKYGISVLGTSIETIIETEDRELFVKKLKQLELETPRSIPVTSVAKGLGAAEKIGFPLILRGAFALGGQGSAVVKDKAKLKEFLSKALSASPQVLIEEYLGGWKEIEYEVVRDLHDNCITVCNMENLDPMGIHTGESIVVAPSQTLTNYEYFKLRELSIRCVKGLKIVGECNIQFALHPKKFEYRIIEVNARLSRSSALASKATGYPLAFVAAKLALGYSLSEIKNSVTGVTSSFFEPALDYLVVKIPRWDLAKFQAVYEEIGTEMKSVGEVMAIGRTFEEAIQKAQRSLDLDYQGIIPEEKEIRKYSKKKLKKMLETPTVGRLPLIACSLIKGVTIAEINQATGIDRWFLYRLKKITSFYQKLKKQPRLTYKILKEAKLLGFSDKQIALLYKTDWKKLRLKRKKYGIIPYVRQIDTLAGEFPAQTNYLYLTYHGQEDDIPFSGGNPQSKNITVLGGGPYHIGSSVEFDWCGVTTVKKLKKMGYTTTVINCNPETVSTDYDISDRLYFEELTLEKVLDIYEKEGFYGIILSMGGQTPNNLSTALDKEGLPILGTKTENIDRAEDRNKFSKLLDKLKIPQPVWDSVTTNKKALAFSQKIGFPVLLRPSYVLSGTSMRVVHSREDLIYTLKDIAVGREYPLVISQFIDEAQEVEVDAVANKGELVAYVLLSHIEEAGVHSGDATIVLGKDIIEKEVSERMEEITRAIAKELSVSGPFNIQFLVKHGVVLVIECNLRASRSFPFSSKVTGVNLINLTTEVLLGREIAPLGRLIPEAIGVKSAQFSFGRLRGADPILQIEMASTGEVACFGSDLVEAYLKATLSAGMRLPKKNILISIGEPFKSEFVEEAKILYQAGYKLFTTEGTALYFRTFTIPTTMVRKGYEGGHLNVLEMIKRKKVDLVINIRAKERENGEWLKVLKERSDGYKMRRAAADHNIPLITNLQNAKLFVSALIQKKLADLEVASWDKYIRKGVQEKLI